MIYHTFELSLCGYSGSGKTTLVEKLIQRFSSDYEVGYLKANAHNYSMDREGKDTYRMGAAGACKVAISANNKWAQLTPKEYKLHEERSMFADCDFVLVEGGKSQKISKIVVIDEDKKFLKEVQKGETTHVVAYVGPWEKCSDLEKPYFHRDDVAGIEAFILDRFRSQIDHTPVYGLVLSGGQSKRMGRDKALVEYHGQSQTEYYFDLVSKYCEKTFVSSRKNQWADGQFNHLPQIHDKMDNFGPMGGILSAMLDYPQAAWLVVACDLPFLKSNTLEHLLSQRHPFRLATAYNSTYGGLPEPLCTIYEPRCRRRLFEYLGLGYQCPRKVLINSHIGRLELPVANALDNANNQEEYLRIQKTLNEVLING